MNTKRRRLRSLLLDLEAQGVRFERDGDSVTIHSMTRDSWVKNWLERNRADLVAILRKPGQPRRDDNQKTPRFFVGNRLDFV